MTIRKALTIFIIAIALLALALLASLFFGRGPAAAPAPDDATPGLREFFPFGRGSTVLPDGPILDEQPAPGVTEPGGASRQAIRQVSFFSVAGGTVAEIEKPVIAETGDEEPRTEISRVIRYVSSATGQLFQKDLTGGSERRLTDGTIPAVSEALFAGNDTVLLRYAKDDGMTIATYAVDVPEIIEGGDSVPAFSGSFLPDNIAAIALDPEGASALSLIKTADGIAASISTPEGENRKTAWVSPLSEWLVQWPSASVAMLTTKASASALGYAYALDPATGKTSKILGDIPGLTANASPDGSKILYSKTENGIVTLSVYDRAARTARQLSLSTFPEKCLWSLDNETVYCGVPISAPTGDLPDSWYQGVTSFNDNIWKIQTTTGATSLVADLAEETGQLFDVVSPFADPDEEWLFFINKKDGTLWQADLQGR